MVWGRIVFGFRFLGLVVGWVLLVVCLGVCLWFVCSGCSVCGCGRCSSLSVVGLGVGCGWSCWLVLG